MKRVLLGSSLFLSTAALSSVKVGGFLDTFYAYDSLHKRTFTTQVNSHNEPNINLAFADVILTEEKIRGRLALQMGRSVDANTKLDPAILHGHKELKHIQEAYLGFKLGEKTWIDGGIYLGHIGAESWISKDNWTYSRSLNLENVPYYSAGIRLEHKPNSQRHFQFHLMNGWQNMSENNKAKSVGLQYQEFVSEKSTFTYNNFFGDEEVVSTRSRFRGYHNFILKRLYSEKWQGLSSFDLGHEAQTDNNGVNAWWAVTHTLRRVIDEKRAMAFRAEYYADPHEMNVATGTPEGFQVLGASMNYDQNISTWSLWRTEVRGFLSQGRIYPKSEKQDWYLATSLSAWF